MYTIEKKGTKLIGTTRVLAKIKVDHELVAPPRLRTGKLENCLSGTIGLFSDSLLIT